MNLKPYPPEKRLIISQKPIEKLVEFAFEVSLPLLLTFAHKLPQLDGFRKGKSNELQNRIKRFLTRVHRWNDKEWMMFSDLWLDWVKTHPKLDALLLEFDNSDDFVQDSTTPPNSHLDILCFEHLALKSADAIVSRELIKRFYDFGYFQVDSKIQSLIYIAKSATELKLFELPLELEKIQLEIKELKNSIGLLDKGLASSARDGQKALGLVDNIYKVEKTLKELLGNIGEQSQSNLDLDGKLSLLQQKDSDIEHIYKGLVGTLDQKHKEIRSETIKEIDIMRDYFDEVVESLGEKVNVIKNENEQKKSEVTKASSDYVINYQEKTGQLIAVEDLSLKTSVEKLDTPDKFASTLSKNFRNIGMQSVAARVLADEILLALSGGQIIFFRGSMASSVVRICASTLAGSNMSIINIPIGLLDGNEFRTSFYQVLDHSLCKSSVSALIIDGINLSAPEVYARSLHQLISERYLCEKSANQSLIIFGTILDGPAALETSPELCELGPIYYTDCLEWRDKWSQHSLSSGFIPNEVWGAWISMISEIPEEWEDIYNDYCNLGGHTSVLWRRCLYIAVSRLNYIRDKVDVPTLIQSLLFGWILPRGLASGVNFANYEDLLNAGRLGSSKIDERIVKILGFINER